MYHGRRRLLQFLPQVNESFFHVLLVPCESVHTESVEHNPDVAVRTCERGQVGGAADDPGGGAIEAFALLDEVGRDDGAAVVRRHLPRQAHRLLRDLRDDGLPGRRVGPV